MNLDELGLEFPDEVTVQLHVTSGMAYALRELAKAYRRLAATSDEAAQVFAEHLAQVAADA